MGAAAAAAAAAISYPLLPPPPSISRNRPFVVVLLRFPRLPIPITSRLHSSNSKSNGESLENHHHEEEESKNKNHHQHQQHNILSSPISTSASIKINNDSFVPVFVMLPKDAIGFGGKMSRRRAMAASFAALATGGVVGVTVEVWWGLVEREGPGVYDWGGYLDLVSMAARCGLKVRAIMAFHQSGTGPQDPQWIPLPWWVLEEMDKEPDLAYTDRFGRRSREYISLGCDSLPVLKGRCPIQAYSDFMRSFRDTFRDFLGVTVTEIQVGMGPAGELRYPSSPTEKLKQPSNAHEFGEFQCYDKHMLASLGACAHKVGMEEWANGCPHGASNLLHDQEETHFFGDNGSWNASYGRFFLEWYSGMLLFHGERLCSVTEAIFLYTGMKISAKVAGIHWHYYTCSHPAELTAGYYNTLTRDGYLPIARMFSRYHMTLCCTCFDMRDAEEQSNSKSSPEGYIRQLVNAVRICNLALCGENSVVRIDDASLKQVIKSSRLYCNGTHQPALSFNYVRMDKSLFEAQNWNHFTRFVRKMSDSRTFQAKLYCRNESCKNTSTSEELGRAFAYH